eukprot:366399-Chlamydomonas_euryale.AAC.42
MLARWAKRRLAAVAAAAAHTTAAPSCRVLQAAGIASNARNERDEDRMWEPSPACFPSKAGQGKPDSNHTGGVHGPLSEAAAHLLCRCKTLRLLVPVVVERRVVAADGVPHDDDEALVRLRFVDEVSQCHIDATAHRQSSARGKRQ